ncbi:MULTISPECIES: RNase P modulator RnpM [unclassified Sporolactobacillus]|uniref:RNase P modulator RnpM n=1 Tax=unclassified Sporolactobacillus TaxID=2628533 RepID=UPI0023677096|nr:YlxR family protein [Sporolactobacillus sp. CQH2019]MDD9147026.1 YlxR family protein [Sporolactobacillus sp. CQH2019]
MPKQRKIPMRKCIACQESAEKKGLFRIVRSPEGTVFLDSTGKKNGRGAYLSKKASCVSKAKEKNLLSRHLGVPVPDTVFDEMFAYLEDHPENAGEE